MKRTTMVIVVLGVIAGVMWSLGATEAQVNGPASDTKIAVVDVAKVLTECQENLDREKEGKEKSQKIKDEISKLKTEVQEIETNIKEVLKVGTDEYNEELQKWFNKNALIEAYQKGQKEVIGIESQAWTEALYGKFLEEVKLLAQSKGIQLVLNKDESKLQRRNIQEVFKMIASRSVLYNSSRLDITAELTEKLDKRYAREKASR